MKRLSIAILLSAITLGTFHTSAAKNANVLDLKHSITDSDIVYPESFETDSQKILEGWYMKNYVGTDNRYSTESDPNVSDAVIEKRLSELPTVIEMPFNKIVRDYIDRYTKRGRAQVTAILGLSTYYMPIFEQALEAEKLPLELKYLPVVESGLDPNAVSKHGATGLWQFMIGPGTGMGLEVSSLVDERRDPYASSKAAAKFLKDLYATYGDWSLAIAAYNCGPGTVNKALRRAGGDPSSHDFWSIYYYLPQETRGYVPMFIAANYVMNHHTDHNISPALPSKPLVTDTIGVAQRLHFNQISAVLDIPVDELRILNPQFRADIIPGTPERVYTLILPSQQVHAYIMSEDEILAYESEKYARRTSAEPGGNPAEAVEEEEDYNPADLVAAAEPEPVAVRQPQGAPAAENFSTAAPVSAPANKRARVVTHTVEQGETLSDIATRYGTDVATIRTDNGLRRNAVRAGQKLRVQTLVSEKELAASAKPAAPAKAATPAKNTSRTAQTASQPAKSAEKTRQTAAKTPKTSNHEVKSGETLSSIAKKNGVSVEELRKANPGLKGDMLHPGDKVNVPAKGAAKSSSKASTSSKSSSKSSAKSSKKSTSKKKKR